jgi:hypothetical protein
MNTSAGLLCRPTNSIAAKSLAAAAAAVQLQTIVRGRLFPRPLRLSTNGTNTEACLTLVNSSAPGLPVFKNFANLRVLRRKSSSSSSTSSNQGADTLSQLNPSAADDDAGGGENDSKPAPRSASGAAVKMDNVVCIDGGVQNDASQMRTAEPSNPIQQQQQQQYTTAPLAPDLDLAGQYNWLQQAVAAVPAPSNARLAVTLTAAADQQMITQQQQMLTQQHQQQQMPTQQQQQQQMPTQQQQQQQQMPTQQQQQQQMPTQQQQQQQMPTQQHHQQQMPTQQQQQQQAAHGRHYKGGTSGQMGSTVWRACGCHMTAKISGTVSSAKHSCGDIFNCIGKSSVPRGSDRTLNGFE